MSKTVVGIGCSHVSGCMIDGRLGDSPDNRNKSFTAQIAKRLGYNHINLGLNGGSNQYIFRVASQFLSDHIDNIQDYFFVIGWSGATRLEFRYSNDNSFEHAMHPESMDKKYIPFSLGSTEFFRHPYTRLIKQYAPDILEPTMLHDHWAAYALNLQTLFEAKGVNYIMCNTVESLKETQNNGGILKLLNTEKYYSPFETKDCFVEYALPRYKKTPCWHFPMPAHADWAKKICKELNYE